MNFDDVEAGVERPARRGRKRRHDRVDVGAGEGRRPGVVAGERLGRRAHHGPAAGRRRHRAKRAVPGERRAALPAGMRQLNGGRTPLRPHEAHDSCKTVHVVIAPDSEVRRADASLGRDGRGFGHRQRGAACGPRTQVDKMPVVGVAVAARVLAHGRDEHAVGQRETTQGHRIKKVRHVQPLSPESSSMLRSDTDLCAATSAAAHDHHQRARLLPVTGTCVMTPFENSEGRAVRAVLLSLVLLLAPALGTAPAAAQEPARAPRALEHVAVSWRRAERDGHGRATLGLDPGRHQPRPRAQPRRCCCRTAWTARAAGMEKLAKAAMLPNVKGYVSESRQVVNLAAYGFPLPDGHPAHRRPVQPVRRARVGVAGHPGLPGLERHQGGAAQRRRRRTHVTRARATLSCLSPRTRICRRSPHRARADAARAQGDTAQALYNQTANLRQSGLVAGIDVLRAEVQLSTERQRITATANEFEKSKLQLARVMGLPLGQALTLVSELPDRAESRSVVRARRSNARTRSGPTTRPRSSGSRPPRPRGRASRATRCRRCA